MAASAVAAVAEDLRGSDVPGREVEKMLRALGFSVRRSPQGRGVALVVVGPEAAPDPAIQALPALRLLVTPAFVRHCAETGVSAADVMLLEQPGVLSGFAPSWAPSPSPSPPPSPPSPPPASSRARPVAAKRANPTAAAAAAAGGKRMSTLKKRGVALDPYIPDEMQARAHVYVSPAGAYAVTLNQCNLRQNNNKFYIMQLLATEGAEPEFNVWFRWGRVGAAGQTALRGDGSLAGAIELFEDKFLSKVGVLWCERAAAKPTPGHYFPIGGTVDAGLDGGDADDGDEDEGGEDDSARASRLPPALFAFLQGIVSPQSLRQDVEELGWDSSRLPLGRLSAPTLERGLDALTAIEAVIRSDLGLDAETGARADEGQEDDESGDADGATRVAQSAAGAGGAGRRKRARTPTRRQPKRNPGRARKAARRSAALLDLCAEYFTVIPHAFGFTHAATQALQTLEEVERERALLESLSGVLLLRTLRRAPRPAGGPALHPLDAQFLAMGCAARVLDSSASPADAAVIAALDAALRTAHGHTHSGFRMRVEQVVALRRSAEAVAWGAAPHGGAAIGGSRLLWHGTRAGNLCGILARGLQIAPKNAPITGHMFGRGIYLTDVPSKAANYCFVSKAHPRGILLCVEAALGAKPRLRTAADPDAADADDDAVATVGLGRFQPGDTDAPAYRVAFSDPTPVDASRGGNGGSGTLMGLLDAGACRVSAPDGAALCAAALVSNPAAAESTLLYNEHIIYKTEQVRLRFAILVHFDFQEHAGPAAPGVAPMAGAAALADSDDDE